MPFFVAPDPRQITPGCVEVWATPYPTREAAEAALQKASLPTDYIVLEAPSVRAAIQQVEEAVARWSR